MDGSMDGWMDAWMGGWIDGSVRTTFVQRSPFAFNKHFVASAASQCLDSLSPSFVCCQPVAMPKSQGPTCFPQRAAGIDIYVGGRADAENADFLKEADIRFVVCATGRHGEAFKYPYPIDDDFKVFQLSVGFEGAQRDEYFGCFAMQSILSPGCQPCRAA